MQSPRQNDKTCVNSVWPGQHFHVIATSKRTNQKMAHDLNCEEAWGGSTVLGDHVQKCTRTHYERDQPEIVRPFGVAKNNTKRARVEFVLVFTRYGGGSR